MKITNMKEVEQNVGKRVKFQHFTDEKVVTGKVVYGVVDDCENSEVGLEGYYSVIFDNMDDEGCTWCRLYERIFKNGELLLLETIE